MSGGMDSPQDVAGKSVHISEDPDSKAQLEKLFEVIHTQSGKGGKSMADRKDVLPESFFNSNAPPSQLKPKHRLGPSISVGPNLGPGNIHSRSMSLPATMDHPHGRQYPSESSMALPHGWELARTADGLSYFIE